MAIWEFPKVKADIKHSGLDNPRYLDIVVGGEKSALANALAYALAHGVENVHKFVGATIDEYLLGAENMVPAILNLEDSEWEALNVFVRQFAAQGWVYGVTLSEKILFGAGKYAILQTPQEMEKHIQGKSKNYDRHTVETNHGRINKLFFVPSPKFTREIWGFNYTNNDLVEKIVKFELPE